jgi:hypothetical protein
VVVSADLAYQKTDGARERSNMFGFRGLLH